jgi:hypothetical protein
MGRQRREKSLPCGTVAIISKMEPWANPFDRLNPGDGCERLLSPRTKKADVAEHPKAFNHVGLLFNESLGNAELLFI